jgi:16S rRNA (guanine966-N2)-methyltransferase
VEKSSNVLQILSANLSLLGGHPGAHVYREEAARFVAPLSAGAYDIAFADPPYADDTGMALVQQWLTVPFAHVFGIEHSSSVEYPMPGRTRRYGSTSLTFFRSDDL